MNPQKSKCSKQTVDKNFRIFLTVHVRKNNTRTRRTKVGNEINFFIFIPMKLNEVAALSVSSKLI